MIDSILNRQIEYYRIDHFLLINRPIFERIFIQKFKYAQSGHIIMQNSGEPTLYQKNERKSSIFNFNTIQNRELAGIVRRMRPRLRSIAQYINVRVNARECE